MRNLSLTRHTPNGASAGTFAHIVAPEAALRRISGPRCPLLVLTWPRRKSRLKLNRRRVVRPAAGNHTLYATRLSYRRLQQLLLELRSVLALGPRQRRSFHRVRRHRRRVVDPRTRLSAPYRALGRSARAAPQNGEPRHSVLPTRCRLSSLPPRRLLARHRVRAAVAALGTHRRVSLHRHHRRSLPTRVHERTRSSRPHAPHLLAHRQRRRALPDRH
ncbi:MAG: hypothetical protein IANPNBLG_05008 [Bryobacteraceae bacterium]|nr:hypothetical protein [Bryobacteraceae bacterium]